MSAALKVNGSWVQWATPHHNSSWHWLHQGDSTTYCGQRRPAKPTNEVSAWNPLYPCKKCLERVTREGY